MHVIRFIRFECLTISDPIQSSLSCCKTMKHLILFFLGCSIPLAFSQDIKRIIIDYIPKITMGMCPKTKAVPEFDMERIYGAWYYQMQIPFFYQEMDLSCARGFWRPARNGSVSVYFTGIMDPDGPPEEACGKLWQNNEDNPGSFKAR